MAFLRFFPFFFFFLAQDSVFLKDRKKKMAFHMKEARSTHTHKEKANLKAKGIVLNSGEFRVTFHPHPVRAEKAQEKVFAKM